jgi:hypothetical protein
MIDIDEETLHSAIESNTRVKRTLAPQKAQEQLKRWMNDNTKPTCGRVLRLIRNTLTDWFARMSI